MGTAQDPRKPLGQQLRETFSLPSVSGKASAIILLGCMAIAAFLVAVPLRWPLWIDAEITLLGWWVLWTGTLTYLLYHGLRVSDDHRLGKARRWFGNVAGSAAGDAMGEGLGSLTFGASAEGCVIAIVLGILLTLLVAAAWLLIEIALPALAFAMYFLIRGMLAHIVNDKHHCERRILASISWGAFWATLYTAPLGLLVWLIHVIAARMHAA